MGITKGMTRTASPEQISRLFHPPRHGHPKWTPLLASLTADTVPAIGRQPVIVGFQRGGDFRLHHGQVV